MDGRFEVAVHDLDANKQISKLKVDVDQNEIVIIGYNNNFISIFDKSERLITVYRITKNEMGHKKVKN